MQQGTCSGNGSLGGGGLYTLFFIVFIYLFSIHCTLNEEYVKQNIQLGLMDLVCLVEALC